MVPVNRPSDDPAGHLELLLALRRIMHSFDIHSRRLEASSEHVTLPQLLCLMAVVADEGLTSRQIAERIHASASTLVGVLDRLEGKRLVARTRDPRDRRRIHITPTAAGRELVALAPSPFGEAFDRAFDALSATRKARLVADLSLMAEMMDAGHAGAPGR